MLTDTLTLILTILVILYFLWELIKEKPKAVSISVKAGIPEDLPLGLNNQNKNTFMFDLKLSQRVSYELAPVNRLGNPAPVEAGSVVVSSSDESICTVVPDPDNELKGYIYSSTENIGVAQFNFKADADTGEGIEEISGFAAVTVLPLNATGFGIVAGTPEDVDPE